MRRSILMKWQSCRLKWMVALLLWSSLTTWVLRWRKEIFQKVWCLIRCVHFAYYNCNTQIAFLVLFIPLLLLSCASWLKCYHENNQYSFSSMLKELNDCDSNVTFSLSFLSKHKAIYRGNFQALAELGRGMLSHILCIAP